MKSKKIAIVHDWLVNEGGAEYVLKTLLELYPEADLYVMVDTISKDSEKYEWLSSHKIYTSALQKLPFIDKYYRHMLLFMPYFVELFDLSRYDLIISSSHAVSKGVITHPHQTHLAYIYSPMRYAWDLMYEYDSLGSFGLYLKRFFMMRALHKLRIWDVISSNRADKIVAISEFISKRIKKSWGKESDVIYPPVDLGRVIYDEAKEDYYITVSRLVEYKRVDLIVEAFKKMPQKKLIVIGSGPKLNELKSNASENIEFKGYVESAQMIKYISKAKAFIFMAKEDFGITPIEAQACGTPVIAYGFGGALETIDVQNRTGIFVKEQSVNSLVESIEFFEKNRGDFSSKNAAINAQKFSTELFKNKFYEAVKLAEGK